MSLLVDTHCHLDFDNYADDLPQVLERARAAGVNRFIVPAIDVPSSRAITRLADEYSGLFAAAGIHPNSTAEFAASMIDELEALAYEARIVAIGEIGLDYYWDKSPKEIQRRAFQAQLSLAARLGLPVIIHNREAHDDIISILENWTQDLAVDLKRRPGVMHSFSAPMAIAERAWEAGFYLGFTGPLTFKKSDELRRIAAAVPSDRILVETDGPFLTPEPHRGKRNEPAYVTHIVDRLAMLRLATSDEIGQITTDNATRLFALTTSDATSRN